VLFVPVRSAEPVHTGPAPRNVAGMPVRSHHNIVGARYLGANATVPYLRVAEDDENETTLTLRRSSRCPVLTQAPWFVKTLSSGLASTELSASPLTFGASGTFFTRVMPSETIFIS